MRHRDGRYRWMSCRGLAVRDEEGRATRFVGSQTDVTDRKALEAQVLHDALRDPLTGLANRALFLDRLGRSVERGKRHAGHAFAALVLDLDRFKLVNEGLDSSLSLLHNLPVDTLKIDRSFVSGLARGAETVRAIVALARSLDLDVVAEGVETADQRSSLSAMGCRYAQGFLFGPALTAPQAASLLAGEAKGAVAC